MAEYNEEDSRGSGAIKSILILIVVILVVLIIFFLFKVFISENPIEANASIKSLPELENSGFGSVLQFYPNMKFNHNNLSYTMDSNCALEKRKNMLGAFDLLSSETGLINFYETSSDNPDINVICSNDPKYNAPEESKFFIAGEGGAKEIVPTGRFNVINKGAILLYGDIQDSITCDWPNTELHELMHVFGFNHSQDPKSLMYPILKSCIQKLDDSVIDEIKRLYSEKNLPDLYFENVSAIKNGRYLDFNISIRNSGDVNANNVSFSILDDGKLVETKELKDISFGSGIIMEVRNLKLLNTDSKKITIVIDYYNKIKEIDKENNIATIKFG